MNVDSWAYSLGNRNEVRLEMRHDGTNAPLYKDGDASLKNNQDTISLSWMIGF